MNNKISIRAALFVSTLLMLGIGYSFAHNKVVLIPMDSEAVPSGYQVVDDDLFQITNAGFFADNTGSCPSGKKVVGGGCQARNSTNDGLENRVAMVSSNPTSSGSGWFCRFNNTHTSSITIHVRVRIVCVNADG